MANQIIVTSNNTVQVNVTPTPTVQANISRAAINAVTNVGTANYANYAGNVINAQSFGHFLPSANITYDLGSPTQRWRDAYFANSTVYIGNAELSANGTSLVVDNLIVTNTNTNGIGNVASLALNGNVATVLAGDGTFVPYTPVPSVIELPVYGRTTTISVYSLANGAIPIYGRTQGLFVATANNEMNITGRSGNITIFL